MASSTSIFTGSSTYSTDFQNLITRATSIASMPIDRLNADKTQLTDQSTALSTLDSKFTDLQLAVSQISSALSGASFQTQVSDSTKLSVGLTGGAVEGSYTVDVVDAGAYATSMTASAWNAPSGAVRSYRLGLGGSTYAISTADNSAGSVAAAINSQFSDRVRATVVNVGSTGEPDYRISLQTTALGDLKPQLFTGPTSPASLQTQQAAGSDTRAASRTAQAWNAGPGLTFQLSLGGQTYALAPVDSSAQSVADAINTAYGNRVTATVVNVGDDVAPDYRISLTAAVAGDLQPDILADDGVNGPTSLQAQTIAGSDTLASSRTTSSWTTDTGPTLTYQLSFGGVKYALTPADNSAAALVSEINSKQGDKVTAALVDLGSGSDHDYRITLTAKAPGDAKPDLIASEVDLQKQQTTGALAHYIVNNSGKDVTSSTRTVSIATGLSVTLLAKDSGTPVSITVTRPTSALSSALSAFTNAYNAAVDAVDQHHGSGALSGQSLVSSLSRALAGLGGYTSDSGVGSLTSLGVELDKTGHLAFNSSKLMAADSQNASGVTSFLGSTTSGFIKAATDALNSVSGVGTGMLATTQSLLRSQISDITDRIAEQQARVDEMTARMQSQMAAADALIASMQQQYNYMSSMFAAMQTASSQNK